MRICGWRLRMGAARKRRSRKRRARRWSCCVRATDRIGSCLVAPRMEIENTSQGLASIPGAEPVLPAEPVVTPAPASRGRAVRHRTYFSEFAVTILIALFGTTFILQAFKIPSESMEPTLLIGDYLLVNKFIFEGHGAWYERFLPYRPIHRGDNHRFQISVRRSSTLREACDRAAGRSCAHRRSARVCERRAAR